MNGVKRGLFSNEAGSGSAPCAAATAETDHPAKVGLVQALGVFIDTIVICSCTAFIMLLTPAEFTNGSVGMDFLQGVGLVQALGVFIDTIVICSCTAFIMLLTPAEFTNGSVGMDFLQGAMQYHMGQFGGVFIDTIVICSCTAFIMLLTPAEFTNGSVGMDFLQGAMQYHMGQFGVVFIAVILWLFSFSTFIGILFYARSNVAYLFGDNWASQTGYKVVALVMLCQIECSIFIRRQLGITDGI